MNRPRPIYEVTCVACNRLASGESKEFRCAHCGRPITVEWGCVTRLEADGPITKGAK